MKQNATQLIQRPDGTEALVLQKAAVRVVRGPDQNRVVMLDQPHLMIGTGEQCGLRLGDPTISSCHVELVATESGYLVRDQGSTNGTLCGGLRILGEALITSSTELTIGHTVLQVSPTDDVVEIPLSPRRSFGALLGQSTMMRQIYAILERVAPTDVTVLLQGESGTGKELAAQSIHDHSVRSEGPLVIVDCGSIPASLIESELFGHEKGAFTGAGEQRRGAMEAADGGTLFLDEIADLPLELQPRLLRFMERRQVKRIGAARYRTVDVRIVAATNKPITAEVEAGRFRKDLFYRLSVVQLEMPALRDRPEDVRLLAHFFAQQHNPDSRAIISSEIEALLVSHRWPGNVRQLRNVVERLAVVPELASRTLRDGPHAAQPTAIGRLIDLPFHEGRRRWQEDFERQYLTAHLERAGGVVTKAAGTAGLPRQSFHRLLRRHGLKER